MLTPLEKHLVNYGPLRNDGSDKFWGLENVNNMSAPFPVWDTDVSCCVYSLGTHGTQPELHCVEYAKLTGSSYCNSILQCLYYSVPFREQVINYPRRTPIETINTIANGVPKCANNTTPAPVQNNALSPTRAKTPTLSPSARNPGGPTPQKPDDKEAPDYKKKQALYRGPLLNLYLDNATTYSMPESLFTTMKDIFEAILANPSRSGVIQPTKFLEVLRKENEMFRTSMHQDAHEFLNLVLNEVIANVEAYSKKIEPDKAINGSANSNNFDKALASAMPTDVVGSRSLNNTGWVHDLFEGTLTSETKCLTCENVSQRDEAFLDLSVDLDQHTSVTSCLRKFSEEEMLCERNKFHCDRCGGLQEAEKRMKIKRCPKILALHLKRFKYTEDLQRLQKLFHRVVYPYHLRLFNTTDDAEDPDRLYELYAVVVHIGGGPYHGHYVSIVKTQDRGWLLFDDENVEPVDKSYVRNFFGDRPGLACAYVLFYQETTVEAMRREQEAEGRAAAAQAVPTPKPNVGLGLKTNGAFMNGLHHIRTTVSPLSEEEDGYDGLDKSATEPPIPLPPQLESSTTPDAASSLTPMVLATPLTKPDSQSKKERVKEEKERKAAEKEREKAEKLRLKNAEARRKENEKREAAEVKAAMEASKAPKLGDDQKVGFDAATNGITGTSTLSRFRPNSKSTNRRPKFWGSKDSRTSDETTVNGEESPVSVPQPPDKADKSKNRFSSLRKKTSNMMLSY